MKAGKVDTLPGRRKQPPALTERIAEDTVTPGDGHPPTRSWYLSRLPGLLHMRRTLPLLLWILLAPGTLIGQEARIKDDNVSFHAEPAGVTVATIAAGTPVTAGAQRDSWREATLRGWIWAPSVRPSQRPGFNLVVSARNGENLRAEPNGERIARLNNGTLLVELERQGQWIRVQRSGWIRGAGIDIPARASETRAAAPADTRAAPATIPASQTTPTPAATAAPPTPGDRRATAGERGATILASPGGDSIATVLPLTDLEVLERQGNWVRVRIEGWISTPALASPTDSGAALAGLAPEVLRSNPDRFRGHVIEWEVQFITFDRAEKIRTDFKEGELFILARPPGDQPGFVYIAAAEDQLPRLRALAPLQRINIVARVRTGRSPQMAAPILELIEIR